MKMIQKRRFFMKNRILTFVIGVLVGAIITTAGFFIDEKISVKENGLPNGDRPQMIERNNGETPPEMPQKMNRERN